MGATAERKNIGVFVDRDIAERFEEFARQTDGSVSAALRRLIHEVVGSSEQDSSQQLAVQGSGPGKQINIRLRDAERQALAEAARARGTSPANWVRSLALVHLMRRPRWNGTELAALHELTRDIRPGAQRGGAVGGLSAAPGRCSAGGCYPSPPRNATAGCHYGRKL